MWRMRESWWNAKTRTSKWNNVRMNEVTLKTDVFFVIDNLL